MLHDYLRSPHSPADQAEAERLGLITPAEISGHAGHTTSVGLAVKRSNAASAAAALDNAEVEAEEEDDDR